MKIINAILKNDTITITLDAKANVHKVYLDSIVNQKNMYSDEDEKHTYVISDFVTQDNTVIVDITEYNETSFIVSVLTSEGNRDEAIAIDQNELYLAKVNLIQSASIFIFFFYHSAHIPLQHLHTLLGDRHLLQL